MITFKAALEQVLSHEQNFGTEEVNIKNSCGRVLAEDILADRDFPPFDRSTRDGIALNYSAIENGQQLFRISGIQPAGTAPLEAEGAECIEIMTGAMVPGWADTIVMYEHVTIEGGMATINEVPTKGQNIHKRGSDDRKGAVILKKGLGISATEIGVLATVGKSVVKVRKLPRVAIISTGDELVEVTEKPLPYQIRKSNIYSLEAELSYEGIQPLAVHLNDDFVLIKEELGRLIEDYDVLLLSGGVSKGKFDHIPEALKELGVEKVFHRVAQRPGKPFWFGKHNKKNCHIFSFPGNPVSTFVSYHIYFKAWLLRNLGLPNSGIPVVLEEAVTPHKDLTLFVTVRILYRNGQILAQPIYGGGSGDLTLLPKSDGVIVIDPGENPYLKGSEALFIAFKNLNK